MEARERARLLSSGANESRGGRLEGAGIMQQWERRRRRRRKRPSGKWRRDAADGVGGGEQQTEGEDDDEEGKSGEKEVEEKQEEDRRASTRQYLRTSNHAAWERVEEAKEGATETVQAPSMDSISGMMRQRQMVVLNNMATSGGVGEPTRISLLESCERPMASHHTETNATSKRRSILVVKGKRQGCQQSHVQHLYQHQHQHQPRLSLLGKPMYLGSHGHRHSQHRHNPASMRWKMKVRSLLEEPQGYLAWLYHLVM